jgi:hypothetical protein
VLEECFACWQRGADQPVGIVAESQETVEEEGQDVESSQERREVLLAVAEVMLQVIAPV